MLAIIRLPSMAAREEEAGKRRTGSKGYAGRGLSIAGLAVGRRRQGTQNRRGIPFEPRPLRPLHRTPLERNAKLLFGQQQHILYRTINGNVPRLKRRFRCWRRAVNFPSPRGLHSACRGGHAEKEPLYLP